MSVDHLLEKPEDVKNAKPIPATLQVHQAIRRMDINCFTIDFFSFKFRCRPLPHSLVR